MWYQPQGLPRLSPTSPLRRGLVSYMPLTGKSGEAVDSVSWTPVAGAVPLAFGAAPRGLGLRLKDPHPSYLTRPVPAAITASTTQPITLRYRIFLNVLTTAAILSWGSSAVDGSPRYYARISAGQISTYLSGYTYGGTVVAQTEYIVTHTFDGTTHLLYLNGVQQRLKVTPWGGNTGSFYLGSGYDTGVGSSNPDLILSDFTVWNRALSPTEVASDAQNPWAIFDNGSSSSAYQAAIATPTVSGGAVTDTSSLAWTESDDSTSIVSLATSPAYVSWIESSDTYAVSTTSTDRVSLTYTENDDTYSINASMSGGDSTASWTEANDSYSIQARVYDAVTVMWTEANDTYSTPILLSNHALQIWTEDNDDMSLTGISKDFGTLGWSESDDGVLFLPSPNVGSGRRRKGIHK